MASKRKQVEAAAANPEHPKVEYPMKRDFLVHGPWLAVSAFVLAAYFEGNLTGWKLLAIPIGIPGFVILFLTFFPPHYALLTRKQKQQVHFKLEFLVSVLVVGSGYAYYFEGWRPHGAAMSIFVLSLISVFVYWMVQLKKMRDEEKKKKAQQDQWAFLEKV